MGRRASDKPRLHSPSGFWCAIVNGKREYLDRDYRVACRKLRELLVNNKREQSNGRDWLEAPFAVLADQFLADVKARRAETTYTGYRYRLLRALRLVDTKIRVCEIRKSLCLLETSSAV